MTSPEAQAPRPGTRPRAWSATAAPPPIPRVVKRQFVAYSVGLIVPYVIALVVFWPSTGEQPNQAIFLGLMLAPTIGAFAAMWFADGRIRWGRPGWWLLAGLVPAVTALAAYALGTGLGWVEVDTSVLGTALLLSPAAIAVASVSAAGEEIGWRGFLWPTLRETWTFWRTVAVVFVVWWMYHVPLILLGWYGSLAGLPAFTVAVAGISLFMGVVTDRSGSLWPSVLAHGAWNGLVATNFAATNPETPAFSGDDALLGEFGWLAAGSVLALGLLAAIWHVRTGAPLRGERQPASAPPADPPSPLDR